MRCWCCRWWVGQRGKQRRFSWRTEALKPQKGMKCILFHFRVPQGRRYRSGKWDLSKRLLKKTCFCYTVGSLRCSQSLLQFKCTSAALTVNSPRLRRSASVDWTSRDVQTVILLFFKNLFYPPLPISPLHGGISKDTGAKGKHSFLTFNVEEPLIP